MLPLGQVTSRASGTLKSHNNCYFKHAFYDFVFSIIYCFRYLIRLPKTTPEDYRVLLYSVRDSDPTKMIFSDAVKGFCMFNDAVLSEDGLQEG